MTKADLGISLSKEADVKHLADASIAAMFCEHFIEQSNDCLKGYVVCDGRECKDFGEISTARHELGKRYHVVVAMKPLVFDDDFPRKPDKNKILELVRDKLQHGEFNDNFVVVVEAKKET